MNKIIIGIKIVIAIIFAIVLFGGYNHIYKTENKVKEQTEVIDSLKGELQKVIIENESYKSTLANSDSIKFENFVLKYKINRIKQYDSIIIRNSSQSKYFRGWVRRVIYE